MVRDVYYVGNPKRERAAVLLRMAPTWFRFGSLEILARSGELPVLRQLCDFVIKVSIYYWLYRSEIRHMAVLTNYSRCFRNTSQTSTYLMKIVSSVFFLKWLIEPWIWSLNGKVSNGKSDFKISIFQGYCLYFIKSISLNRFWVRPWSSEYRQYESTWSDTRLWTVWIRGFI